MDVSKIFNRFLLNYGPWQAFERSVARFLIHDGYDDVRLIGGSGDGGGDVVAHKWGKRFVFQVKFRSSGYIGEEVIQEARNALVSYDAEVPVVVTNARIPKTLIDRQAYLQREMGVPLQIWDSMRLEELQDRLPSSIQDSRPVRQYQSRAVENLINSFQDSRSGLVVMATGLGKTYTALLGLRRLVDGGFVKRALVLAHTNELVYQLERASWSTLKKTEATAVWNGSEKGDVRGADVVFACIDSVYASLPNEDLGDFDIIIIDEAHHAGANMYQKLIDVTNAGQADGPYLLGLTATPWRSDEVRISDIFKETLIQVDMVEGLKNGYLSNVDYRMNVDNLDWEELARSHDVTPRALNKKIFISEWNDAVIDKLQEAFSEVATPRAIVFCNTIQHAYTVQGKINARQFANAAVIHSGAYNGKVLSARDRNLLLSNFHDGRIQVMCVVDIFNEGVDVPDVNIIVFQRVTHSRTIFIQQLGRGLRLKEGKDKVVVLDFVSDIRRIAAGLELQAGLESSPRYLKLGKPIRFIREGYDDARSENFFKEWLDDIASIESAGDDDHVLKFPPDLHDYGLA